nr:putative RNA-dependent RNA polymerase [Poaceae Liege partitivirus 14]
MSKCTHNITDYEFVNFRGDLEDLHQTHSEQVNREEEVIHHDEFALAELQAIKPELYDQFVNNWSRSWYTKKHHMDTILNYAHKDIPVELTDMNKWIESIRIVRDRLRSLPKVRALSVKHELDQVKYVQQSSAGYGYHGVKGPIKGLNHMRAIKRALATLYSATAEDGEGIEHAIRESVPDVGYTRTQLTDLTEKTKVRSVWGRAFHYILLEGTAARPLLEAIAATDHFIVIGQDPIVSVPQILSRTREHSRWLTAIDWSSFDATVNRFEINTAFNLIKEMIQFPDLDTEMAFELSRQLFIHKKIAAPDGKIYWSHKGIPSGSYYTTLVGSIVNRLRIEYLWRIKFNQSPSSCYVLGDDSLIGFDQFFKPDEMQELVSHLGWFINSNKTECSTHVGGVSFLGRTSRGHYNERDLKKCLRLLILPEYPVTSGAISAFRAQSIAQDAGGSGEYLNRIAERLKRHHGIAEQEAIPKYFRKYQFL